MATTKLYALFDFYEENSIDIGMVDWIEESVDVDSIVLNKKEVEIIRSMARVVKFAGRCSQNCPHAHLLETMVAKTNFIKV